MGVLIAKKCGIEVALMTIMSVLKTFRYLKVNAISMVKQQK